MHHGWLFDLEERVGPALGDVHELVDELLVLLVEVVHLLLVLKVHGLVAYTVHLLYRVPLQHPP
jgi:hypothetical protein